MIKHWFFGYPFCKCSLVFHPVFFLFVWFFAFFLFPGEKSWSQVLDICWHVLLPCIWWTEWDNRQYPRHKDIGNSQSNKMMVSILCSIPFLAVANSLLAEFSSTETHGLITVLVFYLRPFALMLQHFRTEEQIGRLPENREILSM